MATKIDGEWWSTIIIEKDAMMLAKRIKFFMEENIPYRIDFAKGIYGEDLIALRYLPPEDGVDFIKMYEVGPKAV